MVVQESPIDVVTTRNALTAFVVCFPSNYFLIRRRDIGSILLKSIEEVLPSFRPSAARFLNELP